MAKAKIRREETGGGIRERKRWSVTMEQCGSAQGRLEDRLNNNNDSEAKSTGYRILGKLWVVEGGDE